MNNDLVYDEQDYLKICRLVLKNAIYDYISLQHPKKRKRKHAQEAFTSAVDMLFDDTYRLAHFKNDDNEDMSLKEFIGVAGENTALDPKVLRNYVIAEALKDQEQEMVSTVNIPEEVIIEGHVYTVVHQESPSYLINYDHKLIALDTKKKNSENQERFIIAVIEITFYHSDIKLPKKTIEAFGKIWFRTLRINNCFVGAT